MTKKQLEKKVAQLEGKISELQSQLLALALRQPRTIFVPAPTPAPTVHPAPHWEPARIGDPPYGWPTTTCGGQTNGTDICRVMSSAKKGKRLSVEHKQKIGVAQKRHPAYRPEVMIGNQYAKGVKHTTEWKATRSAQQTLLWAERRAKRVAIS